ncbi:MAG: glycogen debranching enzyme, partial [Deltaproteobacteria bacterium]|nr:glycogen debranching enzyme [Deltaproteobacteria bacterium]
MAYKTREGNPLILGPVRVAGGINFSVFGPEFSKICLLLFAPGKDEPVILPFDCRINRHGDIWHLMVVGDLAGYRYAYKVYSAADNDNGRLALDPYARYLSGGEVWGQPHQWLGGIIADGFDWHGDRPLERPLADTIIYELHVRGFSRHKSAGVRQPGTYSGLVEKIPYLRELGITAIELLPVFEFDENDNSHFQPESGRRLKNFWGYSPLAFFAPKSAYAGVPGEVALEFKTMVRQM